jgi:hypothetical protein
MFSFSKFFNSLSIAAWSVSKSAASDFVSGSVAKGDSRVQIGNFNSFYFRCIVQKILLLTLSPFVLPGFIRRNIAGVITRN